MKAQATTTAETEYSPEQLAERTVYRRAVEAVLWGMPAVNFDLMLQAFLKIKGSANQIVYWSQPLSWHDQTLTPNPDTIYFNPFYNTKDGPIVLEIPPADGGSITGSVDDAWQNALEDVGPAGVDKGKGGKYLLLPPGYNEPVPDGYIPLQSDTYQGFAILRSNLQDGTDANIDRAVAYGKRIRMYPLSAAASSPETAFVDAYGVMFDATIPYDLRFFESLDRFVQVEPWLTRDKALIKTLKSIGIEKGKPFTPDAQTKTLLEAAVREARAVIDVHYEQVFEPPFNPGTHWALPASTEVVEGMPSFFADPNSYPIDERAVTYAMAYFSAKHLGAGQFYLMSIKDKDGNRLEGGNTYRLNVPANAPVKLYWSATAYDGVTHALIRDTPRSSRGSNSPGLQTNADGSVEVVFGPSASRGKESNWVPTKPGAPFEVLFRFYGPEKALFNKMWILPDIEKI